MSDINDILKQLTVIPATVTTTVNSKDSALSSSLERIFKYIQLPAYFGGWLNAIPATSNARNRRLLFQYNFTFESTFFILNFNQFRNNTASYLGGGTLCVKYRIGSAVFRYVLAGPNQNLGDDYTSQLIEPNCCFEFWCINTNVANRGVLSAINLRTSSFIFPSIIGQLPVPQNANTIVSLNDTLGVNLPETLPYNQPDQAWLNN